VARTNTELAVDRFRAGDRAGSASAALSAYLDGFELTERSLLAIDPTLTRRIEADMAAMRAAVEDRGAVLQDVEKRAAVVLSDLDQAQRLLAETTLAPGIVYSSALVILLREGLEAILILAAIAAFMRKTGRREALTYMHAGWIAALALGGVTWAVSTWLIAISGATRELTEGLTALFAAVVLFYAGFWMHDKLSVRRWNAYLQQHVGKALEGGTLWTLALVSFVAVYREVFETVLFYQALWAQTARAGQAMLLGGAGTAAALLVLAAWGLFKLGVRLPLRQFFGGSAALMVLLALVFAGKGVAALQEGGTLPSRAIEFLPRIDLLGIHPTWQGIGLQLAMIAAAIGLVRHNNREPAAGA
jgi:high-affinity iron transporter